MPAPCHRCGREAPDGAIYCPHCCGQSGHAEASVRGGLRWAAGGAALGVVLAGLAVLYVDIERGTKGMALGIVLACAITGWLLGMVRHHR